MHMHPQILLHKWVHLERIYSKLSIQLTFEVKQKKLQKGVCVGGGVVFRLTTEEHMCNHSMHSLHQSAPGDGG